MFIAKPIANGNHWNMVFSSFRFIYRVIVSMYVSTVISLSFDDFHEVRLTFNVLSTAVKIEYIRHWHLLTSLHLIQRHNRISWFYGRVCVCVWMCDKWKCSTWHVLTAHTRTKLHYPQSYRNGKRETMKNSRAKNSIGVSIIAKRVCIFMSVCCTLKRLKCRRTEKDKVEIKNLCDLVANVIEIIFNFPSISLNITVNLWSQYNEHHNFAETRMQRVRELCEC